MTFIINTKIQPSGFLFFILLSILSATSFLSIASGQSQQPDLLCSNQVCISATIYSADPNTIEFSLLSKISVGWLGLGLGGSPNSMVGNDLAICWPNATGTGATISQGGAAIDGDPIMAASVAFQVQQNKSGVASSNNHFTCTFSRSLTLSSSKISPTATTIHVIYAVGMTDVKEASSGNPQQATIAMHTFTGFGSLGIQTKEGSSTDDKNFIALPPGSGGDNQDVNSIIAAQGLYERLVKVHGILMAIAFLLLFPTGAILVRFFGHVDSIFRWHRPIQMTGFLFVVASFGCIIGAVYKSPKGPPQISASLHAILGVVVGVALIVQICFGVFIFNTFDPSVVIQTSFHRLSSMVHRLWGYLVLILGAYQIKLGLDKYGRWTTGKEAIWYIFYVWIGIVSALFVFGSIIKVVRGKKTEIHDKKYIK